MLIVVCWLAGRYSQVQRFRVERFIGSEVQGSGFKGSPVKFASLFIFDKFNGAGKVRDSALPFLLFKSHNHIYHSSFQNR